MQRYSNKHRTTVADSGNLPNIGLYVIAYMGAVLYVGKAEVSVWERLRSHMTTIAPIGAWLRKVQDDWDNVRLDVLEPPTDTDAHLWLCEAERALIARLDPMFNTASGG